MLGYPDLNITQTWYCDSCHLLRAVESQRQEIEKQQQQKQQQKQRRKTLQQDDDPVMMALMEDSDAENDENLANNTQPSEKDQKEGSEHELKDPSEIIQPFQEFKADPSVLTILLLNYLEAQCHEDQTEDQANRDL